MREAFLGIDLGTSSVKAVLVDLEGTELAASQVRYGVSRPHEGWAEQDPEQWWAATVQAIGALVAGGDFRVTAIGLAGQMHGLVLVGADLTPLRPAIIWSDTRSAAQVAEWGRAIQPSTVESITGFPVATGMLGVSLTWVRDSEPDVFGAARTVMLPKDYLRLRLTGVVATEPTDAGGSLLYDIRSGRASERIFDAMGLQTELFPDVVESISEAGRLTAEASAATGLPAGIPVAAGGGDQSMAAVALGLAETRRAAVAISSGGTVFKRTLTPLDSAHGLHVMPHAVADQWLAMGVVLAAGLSIDWVVRRLFGRKPTPKRITALMAAAESVGAGADGLRFSTQLGGTRTPVADPAARGSMIGLGYHHGQEHVIKAAVEGVCMELCRSLSSMAAAGEPVEELVISGGGARFRLWRQTLSNVSGLPVAVSSDLEHSALGAAFVAAEVAGQPIDHHRERVSEVLYPDPTSAEIYRELTHISSGPERALTIRKESGE